MNSRSSPPGPDADRRRSQRVVLSVPISLSGNTALGPFSEETFTTVINAHGALLGLNAKVAKGQILRLKTKTSPDEQECRVIWIGPGADGRTQCGIEFLKPAPKFWGISFPPSDWSPPEPVIVESAGEKKKFSI